MAILTFFGVIHSATVDGAMYLPWLLEDIPKKIPYQFSLAYIVLAVMLLLLALTKESRKPMQELNGDIE
jgi:AGZA family xanthine/uracil permease-like MFS transporter